MSVEDDVEELKNRLDNIESCLKDSDDFNELRACLKPMTREELHQAFSSTVKKKERIYHMGGPRIKK